MVFAPRLPVNNRRNNTYNRPPVDTGESVPGNTRGAGIGRIGTDIEDRVSRIGNAIESSARRLINAGLNPGGETSEVNNSLVRARFRDEEDLRIRLSLSPKSGSILYRDPKNLLLRPLVDTDGILFPYTPIINISHSANYAPINPTHSNYSQYSYSSSQWDQFVVVGQFTANTPFEAAYVLAVINFMRSAAKMFFGQDEIRGTPPPVLRLSGYGPYMFHSVPVVITNFTQDFENQYDYIDANIYDGEGGIVATSKVPTNMLINVSLLPLISRTQQREFSIEKYARGDLIGSPRGTGTII